MNKDNIMIEQGQRIRFLREKLGLTRIQFNQKTGISASTLRALEVGEIRLSPSKALTLSHMFVFVLGLEPDEASRDILLYGAENKKRAKKPTDKNNN